MFKMISFKEKTYYIFLNEVMLDDDDIANKIGISLEKYIEILVKYGAIQTRGSYYFMNKEDCRRCVEYLNDIYGIILALIE